MWLCTPCCLKYECYLHPKFSSYLWCVYVFMQYFYMPIGKISASSNFGPVTLEADFCICSIRLILKNHIARSWIPQKLSWMGYGMGHHCWFFDIKVPWMTSPSAIVIHWCATLQLSWVPCKYLGIELGTMAIHGKFPWTSMNLDFTPSPWKLFKGVQIKHCVYPVIKTSPTEFICF